MEGNGIGVYAALVWGTHAGAGTGGGLGDEEKMMDGIDSDFGSELVRSGGQGEDFAESGVLF